MEVKNEVAAICGLFCGTCPSYGKECNGCLSDKVASECAVCMNGFRQCADKHLVLRCYECTEFPCSRLVSFSKKHVVNGICHHEKVIEHLQEMKHIGVEQWVIQQMETHTCKKCGQFRLWYERECPSCREKRQLAIKTLFSGWEGALIWSCLDGFMGSIVMDDQEDPKSAMAETGDFCFFAGVPNQILLETLSGFKILVPRDEAWEQLIEEYYKAEVKKIYRYSIKKEPDVFDVEKLTAYINELPKEYELKMFDEHIYEMAKSEEWSVDLCSQFKDYQSFKEYAIGTAILHEGKLVAGASPYGVYHGGIEIEIDTKQEYRQKGLATVCGAKLILSCLEKNLYPSWDAHDLRSVALAEKLGYHMNQPYAAYEFNSSY